MSSAVFRTVASAEGHFAPSALAIGNFDGVHVGHLALLQATIDTARAHGFVPSVLTFDPHPTAVVAPNRTPPMICTLDERIRLLIIAGIEQILILPFTPEVAQMSPRGFVSQILVKSLQCKAVFVGDNFRFGHRKAGTPAVLKDLGAEFGFEPHFLLPVSVRGEVVSSSAIRSYVSAGQVSRPARLLGRCFSLRGPVVSGHGIGARQTVPTLNLLPVPGLVCPRGVFVTETLDVKSGQSWPSITNVGVRPTFDNAEDVTIETFLLSPVETAPAEIEVQFRRFVRFERQFPTPEALKAQIFQDVARAQAYWRRIARLPKPIASIY